MNQRSVVCQRTLRSASFSVLFGVLGCGSDSAPRRITEHVPITQADVDAGAVVDGGYDPGGGNLGGGSLDSGIKQPDSAVPASSDGGGDSGLRGDGSVPAPGDGGVAAQDGGASSDDAGNLLDSGASSEDGGVASEDSGTQSPDDAGVSGHFPRASESVNVALKGPYAVASYTQNLQSSAYGSATAYYPTDAVAPFAAVAFSPGLLELGSEFTWWGDLLASHGFVVILTTGSIVNFDDPRGRGDDLVALLAKLKDENARTGSPLKGKLDTTRLAVMGHSEGGGGALFAANDLGSELKACIPLMPYEASASFSKIKAATLVLAVDGDTVAPEGTHAQHEYDSLPAGTERVYAEIKGAGRNAHQIAKNSGSLHDLQARYTLAWLKLQLEEDARYSTYLYGALHTPAAFTTYKNAN